MYWKAANNPLEREIHTLPLEELTPLYTFHPKIKEDVLESIKKDGLLNPLIVVEHGTIADKLPGYQKIAGDSIRKSKYYVYTGNNRYWAAIQSGATEIDAYICSDLHEITELEHKMYINPRFYDEHADSTRST